MSLLIAFETSTRSPSIAVRAGPRFRELSLASERAHASDLVPALDALLRELGVERERITGVLVGTGPGSYTGLRVGVATALGLARGSAAPLRGLSSGEALAFAELRDGEECCHVLDARQGGFYFARYRRSASEVSVLEEPCVLAPEELVRRIPHDAPLFCEPSVADAAGLPNSAREHLRGGLHPRAGAVLELGARRLAAPGGQQPIEVEPLYLRAFAAKPRRRS